MIFAFSLIACGLVFLLSNLGAWPWEPWETLWNLWPLILIAVGLDLMVGRRRRWLSGVLALAMLLAVLGLSWFFASHPVSWRTETVLEPLGQAQQARISLSSGLANLQLGAAVEEGTLLGGTIELTDRDQIKRKLDRHGEEVTLKLSQKGLDWIRIPFGRGEPRWDLKVTPKIPLILSIDAGVGTSELDLRSLLLTSLTVDTGVGKTELILPRRGRFRAHIDGGMGKTSVRIPATLAASIHTSVGIGQVEVVGNFHRQGADYRSFDFEDAEHRVELTIDAGVGKIEIRSEVEEAKEDTKAKENKSDSTTEKDKEASSTVDGIIGKDSTSAPAPAKKKESPLPVEALDP